MIVHIDACSYYQNGDREGTLIVDLSPPLTIDSGAKNRTISTISEEKIKSFKAWIAR